MGLCSIDDTMPLVCNKPAKNSPTAAAKLRQLLPAFAAHLRSKGWDVQHIRVYVLPQNR